MQGIYLFDIFGGLQVWYSLDDFMNGLESDLYMQCEDDIEHFLDIWGNEEEIFDSANYLKEVAI